MRAPTSQRKPTPGGAESAIAYRARALCVLALVGLVALALRLAYLQLWRHNEFVAESRKLHDTTLTITARRGGLQDRNGIYLVQDQLAYEVTLDPNEWWRKGDPADPDSKPESRKTRCLGALRRWVPEARIDALLQRRPLKRGNNKKKRFLTYDLGKVTPETARILKERKVPGIGLHESSRRSALDGTLAPHIVGFTNSRGGGLEGLEMRLDKTLGGEAGVRKGEFDLAPRGPRIHQPIPGTIQLDRPAEDGRDVRLTLDARVQRRTQDVLAATCKAHRAESGSAVVLDPKTGEILALASWPTFDVNAFTDSPAASRLNRAVALPYEPGSTLKAVTVAAALEVGAVRAGQTFFCSGARRIGTKTIHCADHGSGGAHGTESLLDVIRTSCNVATAQCAFDLKRPRLYEFLKRFGLTRPTGSGLPGENGGQLSKPGQWSDLQLANIGFGQGIAVTPLQLAGAFGVFGDGTWRQPHIVRSIHDAATGKPVEVPRNVERRVVSTGTARQMRTMLSSVVERGTGRNARLGGYTAGGKTGTAQVAEHGHYGGKYVASFVGLAPLSDPQLVVLVAIRDPKGKQHYGGEIAAPAFRQIAEDALLQLRTPRDRQTLTPPRAAPPTDRAAFAEH